MNRLRLLFGFSVVAILAMSLVGCGGPAPTEEPAAEEPTVEEPAPAVEEKVTLTIWDFGGYDFQWLDDILIPAFQEDHPNIEFNHVGVPEEELSLKLETAIAAGEVPDLAVFVPVRLVKAGHILILNDYMDREGLSADDFCPLFTGADMLDDKAFALPITTNQWAMLYNKDFFEAAGLPELGTDTVIDFYDWLEYARAINKPADALEERVWGSTDFPPPWNSMNNYMSDPFVLGDDGRTCEGNANTEDWVRAWTAMVTAFDEDLTTETAGALIEDDMQPDMFVQGKIGMIWGTLGEAMWAREEGINVGMTGQPVISPGWEGNVGGWNVSYSIMAGSEHPDEAWEFLKFLATDAPLLLAGGEGEIGGLPCYLPLADDFLEASGGDELVQQSLELMQRIKPPPFTPDIWTSADPFYEAWRRMTEDGEDVAVALDDATVECQEITDELWEDWEALED